MTSPNTLSLPMYQIGVAKAAYAKIGAFLASELGGLLGRDVQVCDSQIDQQSALVLTQVCGFPFQHRWRGPWVYLATPSFSQLGSDMPAGHYQSVLIARAGDTRELDALRKTTIAVSEPMSQSGHHALLQHFAACGFGLTAISALETGSHLASVRAVAGGEANLAAVDAVTFALLAEAESALCAGVRVIARTKPAPGLPLVLRRDLAQYRSRVIEFLEASLSFPEAVSVGWKGWVTELDYADLTRRRDAAAAQGWTSLIAP